MKEKRVYVAHKSELSALKEAFEAAGATCYRVRIGCECDTSNNKQRNGLIVLSGGRLILEVVRCRGCSAVKKKKEMNIES